MASSCGRQTVKISTKVEYTSNCNQRRLNRGFNGALDRPSNAETAGTRVSFRPFVCFTNLLNIYAEFRFPLLSSALVTVSSAFTNWQRSIGECAESFASVTLSDADPTTFKKFRMSSCSIRTFLHGGDFANIYRITHFTFTAMHQKYINTTNTTVTASVSAARSVRFCEYSA